MTFSQRVQATLCAVVAPALVLSGCAAARPQNMAFSFLPSTPVPAPKPAPPLTEVSIEQPPALPDTSYLKEVPVLLRQTPVETERRLKRAQELFENGKRAYQDGDTAAARRSFDRALDILLTAPEKLTDRQRLERRLDELVDAIYRYDTEGLGAGETTQTVVYDPSPLASMLELTFPIDPQLKPKVKEEIQATRSQLPLEENDTVLGYIHYFSTDRGRKALLSGLRRSGRYRSLIQRVLNEEGVPEELIFLAQAESGFLPRAVSNKKAAGMWQFVDWRGREYGLEASSGTDDRLDPEKATRAAAQHLRDLYALFGDWYLAMAAYNCGPNCVDRAVQHTGYADFWELASRNALPRETMNYVPLILAITIMSKNPKDYGLEDIDFEPAMEYDTIQVQTATSLQLLADAADRTVSEMLELNPALLKPIAPVDYLVHVPKGAGAAVQAALDTVPFEHRTNWRLYRMESGDTFDEVAKRFGAQPALLASLNRCEREAPEAGDLLVIPARESERPAHRDPRRSAQVSSAHAHRNPGAHSVKSAALLSPNAD